MTFAVNRLVSQIGISTMEIQKSLSLSSVNDMYSRIVYTSILLQEFNTYEEIEEIIHKSQLNNRKLEICGEIIWNSKKSSIIQILEGPSTHVNALLDIIKKDCRHKNFKMIACEDITKNQKIYEVWSASTLENSNISQNYNPEINDFQMENIIGTGGFSTVVKSYNHIKKKEYAIKIISKKGITRNLYNTIISEKKIWQDLTKDCENNFINKLYWTLQDGLNIYFVMDLVNCGDMFDLIRNVRLDSEDCLFYLCEILCGINYIHDKNTIYRDLKLENILIKRDGHILLTDFGVSQKICETKGKLSGTPLYFSPEMINDKIIDKKNDIWALGIILYEMTGNVVPWQGRPRNVMFPLILQSNINLDLNWENYLNEIIQMCMIYDYNERKNAKEIIEYIISNNLVNSWEDVENKKLETKIFPNDKCVESNIFSEFNI
tara:strand:+ start:5029 stop:6330 length:1302 start_codon:yes stop_codon:yes gene_type:complete